MALASHKNASRPLQPCLPDCILPTTAGIMVLVYALHHINAYIYLAGKPK